MQCPSCGAEIAAGSLMCAACGKRFETPLGGEPGAPAVRAARAPVTGLPAPARADEPAESDRPPSPHPAAIPYAGFWSRVGAYLLDYVLLVVAAAVIATLLNLSTGAALQLRGLETFVVLVITLFYYPGFECSPLQATPGKRALGLKVTDLQGRRLGFGRALGRTLGKFLSNVTLGFGYLMAAFTARRQCLHDVLAGTLVVRREVEPRQVAAAGRAPRASLISLAGVALVFLVVPAGLLVAIAIPAYRDYGIRAQVAEALFVAAPLKADVAERWSATGASLDGIDSATLGWPTGSDNRVVSRVVVESGVILVTFGKQADAALAGRRLAFFPVESAAGGLQWVCGRARTVDGRAPPVPRYRSYTTVPDRYLPQKCRSAPQAGAAPASAGAETVDI